MAQAHVPFSTYHLRGVRIQNIGALAIEHLFDYHN